jgi:hypothetical protein
VVTFTFHATALRGETVTWYSAAKQSNDFRGTNNSLVQTNTSPVVTTVSSSCGGVSGDYDATSCQGIPIDTGGEACTGDITSQNTDSTITACTTLPPVPGAVGVQVLEQVTRLNVQNCALNVLSCAWTWEELNKYSTYYDSAHTITVTIYCGDLCGAVGAYLQQNTTGGNPELLPPCFQVTIPSLAGSTACYTPGSGKIVITGVTHVNDYKVMLPNGTTIG